MSDVQGTWTDRFAGVRDTLAKSLREGTDLGAACAVYLDGEPVVDIWGGCLDTERTRPWQRDTLVNVFSSTKTVTALAALVLADRGELDLDAPVARYWPQFAASGKQDVLVRHVLAHTAGLPTWDAPMRAADLYDWQKATSLLAAQTPRWKPGTACGYHAHTQGYLIGEVIRRITGITSGAFVTEAIADPLGADFHIGLPEQHDRRVAPVVESPSFALDPNEIRLRATLNPRVRPADVNSPAWRRAEIPAANGHGNARSLARIQSVLAGSGQARGIRLLTPAGCSPAVTEQYHGVDTVLGIPLSYGAGYALSSPETPVSPNPRACFWGGRGGSLVVVDLDARMVVAYTMNLLSGGTTGDMRGIGLVFAAYAALAQAPR